MGFTTDQQTLTDLDIFGKKGRQSVYAIFNHTRTSGGAALLEEMFKYPLADDKAINRRSATIRYIHSLGLSFPVKPDLVDAAEKYLENTDSRSRISMENNDLRRKFRNMIGSDVEQQLLFAGIAALVVILHDLRSFLDKLPEPTNAGRLEDGIADMRKILGEPCWLTVFVRKPGARLSFADLAELDKLFRFIHLDRLKELLHSLYRIDVYLSVALVAQSEGMVYAVALPNVDSSLKLRKVYHPFLKAPVGNSINITGDRNMVFLTGANMAGKSTFMKSVGVAMYLAHMGFPVPGEEMEFTVCDGLLTTINLSDNLNTGYSHFYAEVLRVKKMAEQVKMGKHLFIIFDELFRGTNVKDAYEATFAITDLLSRRRKCLFMVSTHILEAGETLKQQNKRIQFVFLPTKMEGDRPVYTYRLEPGISGDRHGMLIIRNENILNILKRDLLKAT
jgi:DNA mismatch repair protein MutS